MPAYNFVSVKRLLSKISRDFNLKNAHWHSSAIEWIAEGIKEIGTIVPYEKRDLTKTVYDHKLLLPCEFTLVTHVLDAEGCDIPPYNKTVKAITTYEDRYEMPAGDSKHYTVNGRYLNFSFKSEKVTVIYTDFILDEDGYPMIVDIAENLEALAWYVMFKYLLGGNPHPTLNWKEAEVRWINYKAKATNQMNLPSPAEMEAIMSSWLGSFPNYKLN